MRYLAYNDNRQNDASDFKAMRFNVFNEPHEKSQLMTSHAINDLDIQALVDDELDGQEKAYVQKAVNADPAFKNRFDQLRRQGHLIFAACSEDDQTSVN